MDVPPPSPGDTNPQSFNEEQPPQQLLRGSSGNNMMTRSAAGTNEYSLTGHKYTISTCPTAASGPSTSQTWASGPGTVQISSHLLQDGDSALNTSVQGAGSTRLMPMDAPKQGQQFIMHSQAAAHQQTVSSSLQLESQTIRTGQVNQSQTSQWNPEGRGDIAAKNPVNQEAGTTLSVYPRLETVSEYSNSAQAPQVPAAQWNQSNSANRNATNSQPALSTTQWNSENINASQSYSESQVQTTKTSTALAASYDNRENLSGTTSSLVRAETDEREPIRIENHVTPMDMLYIPQNAITQETSTSRQSSGLGNMGSTNTGVETQNQSTQNRRVVTGKPRETIRTVSSELDYANQKVSENVVRREYGEPRIVSTNERRDESRMYVKSEVFITHEVKVPKRVTREQITERTVVEQEKKLVEEIVQEQCTVKERIVEWSRPKIIEKVVEQLETVYQETTINVTETIQKSNIKYQEKEVIQERRISQPRVIERPVPVDVVEVKERIIPTEKIVYVDEIVNEEKIIEKVVPQFVDQPVPNTVEKEVVVDVERNLPVCVEAETVCDIKVPTIVPRYKKIAYPVYLPKFIEVPMALDLMTESLQGESVDFVSKINGFTKTAASLCDIENLASNIMRMDHGTTAANLMSADNLQAAVMKAWNKGTLGTDVSYTSTAAMSSSAGLVGASSGQYVSSTYAPPQSYKNEIPQSIVAVS